MFDSVITLNGFLMITQNHTHGVEVKESIHDDDLLTGNIKTHRIGHSNVMLNMKGV
jgi:hypothetical protein